LAVFLAVVPNAAMGDPPCIDFGLPYCQYNYELPPQPYPIQYVCGDVPFAGYHLTSDYWQRPHATFYNVNLAKGVAPGDFPPISTDLPSSSSPLVSSAQASFRTQSGFPTRPMLGGLIDMISGSPLLQEVDLELSFGSATFRHVRTYSEAMFDNNTPGGMTTDGIFEHNWWESGAYWDWNGTGWMMGESPLLLVDAHYYWQQGLPKRCYFVPDSHHAIPFEQVGDSDTYVAPSWIDAVCEYDRLNKRFYVSTHGRSITYSFKVYEQCMGVGVDSNFQFRTEDAHQPWPGPGPQYPDETVYPGASRFGIPYLGVATRIEDSLGNRIEIETIEPQYFFLEDDPYTPCTDCSMNANEVGQVRSVRLFGAGSTAPSWTLIYTHRASGYQDSSVMDPQHTSRQPHVLHSIHAFTGQVPTPPLSFATISFAPFIHADGLEDLDHINPAWVGDPEYPALQGWAHKVQYMYGLLSDGAVDGDPNDPNHRAQYKGLWLFGDFDPVREFYKIGHKLLKVTVSLRNAATGLVTSSDSVYRYDINTSAAAMDQGNSNLTGVFRRENVASIAPMPIVATPHPGCIGDCGSGSDCGANRQLRCLRGDSLLNATDPATGDVTTRWYQTLGEVSFHHPVPQVEAVGPLCVWIGRPGSQTVARPGVSFFVDKRDGKPRAYFVYHFLSLPITNGGSGSAYYTGPSSASGWAEIYHYPYRYSNAAFLSLPTTSYEFLGATSTTWAGMSEPVWSCVIDELAPESWDPLSEGGSVPGPIYSPSGYRPASFIPDEPPRGILSRRCVEMNAAGFVLRDRTWLPQPDGTLDMSQVGYADSYKHDCAGRLLEHKTKGYSVAERINSQGDPPHPPVTKGLVFLYSYPTACYWNPAFPPANPDPNFPVRPCLCDQEEPNVPDCSPPADLSGPCDIQRSPIAVRIKRGDTGDPYYLQTMEYDPERRELVRKVTQYVNPVTVPANAQPQDKVVTETTYVFEDFDPDPERDAIRMRSQTVWTSPAASGEGAGAAVLSTRAETWNDDQGRVAWVRSGLFDDPSGQYVTCTLNHTVYDTFGRVTHQIEDVDPGNCAECTAPPPGWARLPEPPQLPALKLTTRYEYDATHGLVRTYFPNGREAHVVYKPDPVEPDRKLTQWTFQDLKRVDPGNPESGYELLGPFLVKEFEDGRLKRTLKMRKTAFDGDPDGEGAEAVLTNENIERESTPTYSATGQIAGASVTADGQSLTMGVLLSFTGEPLREETPDGTITRNVFDFRGRLERTYRGTTDRHPVWGLPPSGTENDNLALVEKRYYGNGLEEQNPEPWKCVDKLIQTRRYRDVPANQYDEVGPTGPTCPPGGPHENEPVANNEDGYGWVGETEYDWRNRAVATRERESIDWFDPCAYDPGYSPPPGNVLRSSLTWLDNQGRTRFSASYAGDIGDAVESLVGAVDPRNLGPAAPVPTAAAILAATTNPGAPQLTSLSETIYNARGQVEISRTYNVDDVNAADGLSYTETRTYYDHANRPVEVHAPNSPIMRYVYDAKGRQVRSISGVATATGFLEVSRSDTQFDTNDRAIATRQFERLHNAGPSELTLSAANAIITYTETWYDDAGRVIASANYGTNNESGVFENGTQPAVWNTPPPVRGDPPTSSTATMLVTRYEYDAAGRQSGVTQPDGSVTRTEYDGLGRVLLTIENADAASAAERRVTAYKYDEDGRLSHMAAVLPAHNGGAGVTQHAQVTWGATDGSLQVTEMVYGATVVNQHDRAGVSQHNGWIQQVKFPDRGSGQPSATHTLTFTYFPDGAVASRTDALGVTFHYEYDEESRLTEAAATYPAADSWAPPRCARVTFEYDAEGRPTLATAYDEDENLIAEDLYEHDGFDNLTAEWQAVGFNVSSGTPRTVYNWDFSTAASSGGNYNRLATMVYPRFGTQPVRTLTYGYNGAGSLDDELSRIATITSSGTLAYPTLAQYTYNGMSRRAGVDYALPNAGGGTGVGIVRQSFTEDAAGGISYTGLPGLDAFGRIKNLSYRRTNVGGIPVLHSYQYVYDLSGNRIGSKVVQKEHDNDRSFAYAYDELQRLTSADRGTLTYDSQGVPQVAAPTWAADWALDNLGNWEGPGAASGLTISEGTTITSIEHDAQLDNALKSVLRVVNDGVNPPSTTFTAFVVNAAGNQVFDGAYVYWYDAWNRLAQVREAGSLTVGDFDVDGKIVPGFGPPGDVGHVPGPLVARFRYDARGRLVAKTTPVTFGDPDCWTGASPEDCPLRDEVYYYDGVRRLKEVVWREEEMAVVPEGGEGSAAAQAGLEEPVTETSLNPLLPVTIVEAHPDAWEQKEYVYGPDYVDEFVCQIFSEDDGIGPTGMNRPLYMLQDANYNVVGLARGYAGGGWTAGEIAEQYTFGPYGQVLASETFTPPSPGPTYKPPLNPVGHQGLFFVRFDAPVTTPVLQPAARGLYHVRNRWLDSLLGRFTGQDDNATGTPNLTTTAYHGETIHVMIDGFDTLSLYGDGANLFGYLGSNPVNRGDALGLVYDPFEDADAAINEYAFGVLGASLRLAEARYQIGRGAALAAAYAAAAFLWDDLVWSLSEDALIGLVTGGLGGRACFEGNTIIHLADGSTSPISEVSPGDIVHTENIDGQTITSLSQIYCVELRVCGLDSMAGRVDLSLLRPVEWLAQVPLKSGARLYIPDLGVDCEIDYYSIEKLVSIANIPGVVTGVSRVESVPTLRVGFESEADPVITTADHPFYSEESKQWTPARQLRVGESVRTMHGTCRVASKAPGPRSTVYNIESSGYHTYCVSGRGIVVHNSCWNNFKAMSYGALRYAIKKAGAVLQAHHLIEKRFARLLNMSPNEMLSIALTKEQHQFFTNAWRRIIPYGEGTARATREIVEAAARQVYRDYPEILRALGL
jgi:YD repeat-containing protein